MNLGEKFKMVKNHVQRKRWLHYVKIEYIDGHIIFYSHNIIIKFYNMFTNVNYKLGWSKI